MALTRKQQRFVEEYTVDFNATQAAIRAGYSERTARAIGSENLAKPDISAAIQERVDTLAMKADEVLLRLSDMARGDLGDFMDIESMSFNLSLKKAKELGLTHLIKKVKQRTTIRQKRDGDEEEEHWVEIELHDAQSALSLLAKHHKLLTDKVEHSGDVEVKHQSDEGLNRAVSTLADALGEILHTEGNGRQGSVDAPEHTAVEGSANKGR